MLEQLKEYDWEEAFYYTNGGSLDESGAGPAIITENGPAKEPGKPFYREDVATIIASVDGERDWEDWLMYGQLKDGRYFFLSAGCDYTGWDCRAHGHCVVSNDRSTIERLGMTQEEKTRLGI